MEDQKTKKPIHKKWWFWAIIIVVIFILIGSGSSNKNSGNNQTVQNNSNQQQSYTRVTAADLAETYKANQVAADNEYKGKIIEVSGTIKSIGKDILDTPYVTLDTGDLATSVQCMFDKSDEAQLASLSKDTKTVLRGKVSGQTILNIIINSCSIVE